MSTYVLALFLAASPAASPVTLNVEVVQKPAALQKGLIGHAPLVEGTGMLFVLPKPEIARFWMRKMEFSIDILFLRDDGRVANVAGNVPPCPGSECPVYQSIGQVTHVLEVPPGWSRRHNVEAGSRLIIDARERTVTVAVPVQ